MGYPSRLLNPHESVVVELHPHWLVLAKPAVVSVVAAGGAVALLFAFPGMPVVAAGLLGAVIAAGTGWLCLRWAQRSSTVFVVTTERVALRGGILVKRGWDIRLDRVNDVAFDQTFFGRLLSVGDLWVDTGGEAGMKGMAHTPHPEAVRSLIFEKQEERRFTPGAVTGGPVPGEPGVPGPVAAYLHRAGDPRAAVVPTIVAPGISVAEQLEKLDDLRRRGVITDAEFEAEKSRLIGI